jgi:hypothetical protein
MKFIPTTTEKYGYFYHCGSNMIFLPQNYLLKILTPFDTKVPRYAHTQLSVSKMTVTLVYFSARITYV